MTRRSKAKAELGLTAAMVWLACAGLFSSRAWAQASPPPSDVYRLNYYANAHTRAPDATVHIVNPTAATLCADIYVFDANQNENECCSCPITHNGLLTLSVNRDLTSNPLTPNTVLTNGVIKIVSTVSPSALATTCNAKTITADNLAPELRAWITHYTSVFPGAIGTLGGTEEEFAAADLSDAELTFLTTPCNTSTTAAAPTGVCTCGSGSPGSPTGG